MAERNKERANLGEQQPRREGGREDVISRPNIDRDRDISRERGREDIGKEDISRRGTTTPRREPGTGGQGGKTGSQERESQIQREQQRPSTPRRDESLTGAPRREDESTRRTTPDTSRTTTEREQQRDRDIDRSRM